MKRIIVVFTALWSLQVIADPYEPYVIDDFFFYSAGESRSYKFKPKRLSRTEVVLYSHECDLPASLSTNHFEWIITYQLKNEEKILEEGHLKERAWWSGGWADGHGCYESISFKHFESIAYELFPSEYTLSLIVEKTDKRYGHQSNSLKIGVRKSPVP